MFSRSHFIKKRRIISQWTCSCLLIFFIIFSTLLCTSCFHHSSNNANNVFGSLCYLKKLFFSYSPQVMHILCCNLDHLTISLPSFVAKKLFILIERSSTNFRIFFALKMYEWNKCVCVGIFYVRWWCAFLFDCLVGFMPARHIYMRPAQIIIHSTVDTNQPLRLVQMEHTHINYLDALNCTGSASVQIYHHTAYTSIWLINFLCSWCSIDKIIFYFERKLSMVIFFIWN